MKRIAKFVVAIIAAIAVMGCTNQSTVIGLDLMDDVIGTDFTDTITVEAYSVMEDTIKTSQLSSDMIGSIYDPVFGESSAAAFARFTLSGSSVNFGDSPVLDSVVLSLQISGYYGDTLSKCNITVHNLEEELSASGNYHQDSEVAYNPSPINYSLEGISIKPKTSVVVDTGIYNPHLRIRLSQAFGQYLIDNQEQLNGNINSVLKGLCIKATTHTGNVGYILSTNMNSALTGIIIYYHNNSASGQRYQLSCAGDNVHFSQINHNYSVSQSSDFVDQVLNGDKEIGKKVLFAQGGGGVKTKITFPHIASAFAKEKDRVVVHRAELVITNVRPDEQFLIQPTSLTLQGISKTDGKINFIPDDDYYMGTAYFGGLYESSKKEYRFRITKYVQQQIMKSSDLENSLYLVVRGAGVRPNRLVFAGTDDAESRLRLEISYSKY